MENDDLRVFKNLPDVGSEIPMEEYEKCLESPAYFYNNYVMVKDLNGDWVKPKPVTDEELEEAIQLYQEKKRKLANQVRLRNIKSFMRMFPEEFQDKEIVMTPEMREELKKL
jgi:hypothetical protein